MSKQTRLLGIDYGTVRVGIAISDADQRIASPLEVYRRRTRDQDAAWFRHLVQREGIGGLIVGLPLHFHGGESQKSAEARAFGSWLAEITSLPVDYWDERCTTVAAEEFLWKAGLSHKRRKERRDQVAAQILLQSYLDSHTTPDREPAHLS